MPNVNVSVQLQNAMTELWPLQELLLSEDVDPRVLSDFRDALNRVRNTAWAAQQSVAAKMFDQGSDGIASIVASERVRNAYQLCLSVQQDLAADQIQFQKGQLTELHSAATRLVEELKERL